MRRILFLEALSTISGGQSVLLEMIPALRASYQLSVALPGAGPLAQALSALDVPWYSVPGGDYTLVRKTAKDVVNYALRLPWLVWLTWRLIRKKHIDLVYANSGRVFVWGTIAAALAGRPIVWHHHNLLADGKTLAMVRVLGRWRVVRRIICVSAVAHRQFPALEHKTTVIPTGVDPTIFYPDPLARRRLRAELNISAETPVVGLVGDIIPLKGQHTLLEAMRLSQPNLRCLIIGEERPGDGESSAYAATLRQNAGRQVTFMGRRPDLPAVLNALDLLVIASERETGPLVLIDALACGVPVISTPVGRAPELLSPDCLFPIHDAAALANRLQFWLSDPDRLHQAGQSARALAESRLTQAQFYTHLRAEMERIMAEENDETLA